MKNLMKLQNLKLKLVLINYYYYVIHYIKYNVSHNNCKYDIIHKLVHLY